MKKFKIWTYICLCSAIIFSLVNINFAFNVSVFAFPLSAAISAFLVYFAYFKLFPKWEYNDARVVKKLIEYMPFVFLAAFILRRAGGIMNPEFSLVGEVPYWYDVVCVLLWTVNFISCQGSLYFLNDKRISKLEFKGINIKSSSSSDKSFKKIFFEVIDWVDAIVQAVCMVLLFQIFILQLYVIPSESMVPEFLVKDRVVVLKTPSGPKFPLSDVGIPCFKDYKKGDVVVFKNPHYNLDKKSEMKSVISQVVYMLTFTTVNLNVDENGQPKADPLVKRICGLPGEQLVMQDGVLYSRTKDSDEFKPVAEDAKFACWNLNSLPSQLKRKIQMIPLAQKQYDCLLEVEEARRNLDINSVAIECKALANEFSRISKYMNRAKDKSELNISMFEYDLFNENADITEALLDNVNGTTWFRNFMTDWIDDSSKVQAAFENDMYAEANYKLNLMIKLCFGRLVVRAANLMSSGQYVLFNDSLIKEYLSTAEDLTLYTMVLDQRNMPVFPANENGNPNYIPEDCYFLMGDNRFNSLDMRHAYEQKLLPLTNYDDYSVTYYSNIAPQYVNKKHILGTTLFRFWPLNRVGIIKK